MMGAVHHQGLSEKVLQGRGGCPYPVEPVPTRRLAVAGQVLDQCASEKHVQHLQSPANSQNRLFLHNELLQQEQLSRVPLWLQPPAGGVCLAVAPGLHIAAAGQQQGGTPHRIPQIRRGQGPSTCYLQRTLVIDVLARQAPEKHCWTQGDPSCQISQAHSIRAARPEFRPVVKSGAKRNERKVKRFSLKLSRKYAIIKPLPVSQDGTVQSGIEVVTTSLT